MRTLLLITTIVVLILNACAIQNTQKDIKLNGSYKIGVMLALTGDAATYGLPEQTAIKIAIDEINAKGGINGRKLELIYEDGKCNPKDGNAAAQN